MSDDDYKGIHLFEQKHTISVLLFLYDNGTSTKMQVYNAVSTNPRVSFKLDCMAEEGLITMEIDKSTHRTTYIQLTEKGEAVARLLSAIDEVMAE